MSARAVVVGAGAGGLAAALDLAVRGLEVTVIERAATVGGKIRQVEVGERAVDVGPTVLTMRWVLDELWAAAGASLDEDLQLVPLDPIARHFWSDGSQLDLHGELERDADAIGALAGAREAAGYREFRAYSRRIFEAVERPFLRGPRPTLGSMLGTDLATLAGLLRIDARRTLWQSLGEFFVDPRLRQLFARYATYAGSSPLSAPATLNVIAEVEQQSSSVAARRACGFRPANESTPTSSSSTPTSAPSRRVASARRRGGQCPAPTGPSGRPPR